MADPEQLEILKQGVEVWNDWRRANPFIFINLAKATLRGANIPKINLMNANLCGADLVTSYCREADFEGANLQNANFENANLRQANLENANLMKAQLSRANLINAKFVNAGLFQANLSLTNSTRADFTKAILYKANLTKATFTNAVLIEADIRQALMKKAHFNKANLSQADIRGADLDGVDLQGADLMAADLGAANLSRAQFDGANLSGARIIGSNFWHASVDETIFGNSDLSETVGLESVYHRGPSSISTDVFSISKGNIPEVFLQGCGLSDWEIEAVKLYNPSLSNEERNKILYKIYDLTAGQALQVSPLFISYSQADGEFVNKIGNSLTEKGIRYWRDIHEMKAGRIEAQIDRGIRQNPTVLLILSEQSLASDWVEHEVRTARALEKEMGRDVLCPVALDDSWKSSRWPKRIMEQIMEYNILDFSAWKDDSKFDGMFRKLIDGLELFYKG